MCNKGTYSYSDAMEQVFVSNKGSYSYCVVIISQIV